MNRPKYLVRRDRDHNDRYWIVEAHTNAIVARCGWFFTVEGALQVARQVEAEAIREAA